MLIDLTSLKNIINTIYYQLLKDNKRFLVLYGGAGSGKSVFAVQKIIYRIITERNHKILVIRKVAATLRDSVFALMQDQIKQWGLWDYCQVNKSDFTITFPVFNSQIIFKGLDDPEKIKSIANITSVWIEEASELSERDFKEVNRRVRGEMKGYKQIILTFNPVDVLHWLKRRFFDNRDDRTTTLKTTYKDNRFIDADYAKELESETDEILRQIYTMGEWGQATGVIFSNYEACDLSEKYEHYKDKLRHGCDFGFNDPLAFGVQAIDQNKKEIYIFKEVYKKGLQTNWDIFKEISPLSGNRIVVCDCAEPKSINELQSFGLNAIACIKGKDSIMAGIKFLKQYKILIDYSCKNAINEFRVYRWREDKIGNQLDEPIDNHNHFIDQLRYSFMDLIGQAGIFKWEVF